MGVARILSGGTDGRYTIELDYGKAQRDQLLTAYNIKVSRLTTELGTLDAQIAAHEAELANNGAALKDTVAQYINTLNTPGANLNASSPNGTTFQDVLRRTIIMSEVAKRQTTLKRDALAFELAAAHQAIAELNRAIPIVTKPAWCTTFTEDGAGTVATIDINGESNLTLIAPEARPWAPADGVMTMPHVMSPEQAYFNTAIFPGWQKHKPQYRWGTITGLDYDEDTADVALAPATSSAQNLNINKFTNLTGIPVQYMSCNSRAFEIGSRCVVQFTPGALAGDLDAKVIGFLDNPRPCGWPVIDAEVTLPDRLPYYTVVFFKASDSVFNTVYQASLNNTLQVLWRVNGTQTFVPLFKTNQPGATHGYTYQQLSTTTEVGYELNVSLFVAPSQTYPHRPPMPFLMASGSVMAANRQIGDYPRTVAATIEVVMRIGTQVVFNAAMQTQGDIGPVFSIPVKSSGGTATDWRPPGYPTQSPLLSSIPVLPLDYTLNPTFPP